MANGTPSLPQETRANVQISAPGTAQSTVVGALSGLLSDLKSAPILLMIVLLNMAFVSAGAWYLLKVEEYRAADRAALAGILDKCLGQSVPVEYLLRQQKE